MGLMSFRHATLCVALCSLPALSVAQATVATATAEAPSSCAAFSGGWTGDWGSGKRWLWIGDIGADCSVRYSYGPQQPRAFKQATIEDGKLTIPCGSNGGVCRFSSRSDSLAGNYGGLDGTNYAVFKKTN